MSKASKSVCGTVRRTGLRSCLEVLEPIVPCRLPNFGPTRSSPLSKSRASGARMSRNIGSVRSQNRSRATAILPPSLGALSPNRARRTFVRRMKATSRAPATIASIVWLYSPNSPFAHEMQRHLAFDEVAGLHVVHIIAAREKPRAETQTWRHTACGSGACAPRRRLSRAPAACSSPRHDKADPMAVTDPTRLAVQRQPFRLVFCL